MLDTPRGIGFGVGGAAAVTLLTGCPKEAPKRPPFVVESSPQAATGTGEPESKPTSSSTNKPSAPSSPTSKPSAPSSPTSKPSAPSSPTSKPSAPSPRPRGASINPSMVNRLHEVDHSYQYRKIIAELDVELRLGPLDSAIERFGQSSPEAHAAFIDYRNARQAFLDLGGEPDFNHFPETLEEVAEKLRVEREMRKLAREEG